MHFKSCLLNYTCGIYEQASNLLMHINCKFGTMRCDFHSRKNLLVDCFYFSLKILTVDIMFLCSPRSICVLSCCLPGVQGTDVTVW
jgi:hypothetical protein